MKKLVRLILKILLLIVCALVFIVVFFPESNLNIFSECVKVPKEYVDTVNKAGNVCENITPELVAAVIQTESKWNPNVTSHAGAKGLGQFMSETFNAVGQDGDGDGKAEINNPYDSIYSTGVYLCKLHEEVTFWKTNNNVEESAINLSLAAYNAGLSNVKKYAGTPPFEETKNYVEKITAIMQNPKCTSFIP